jgi:hypothetical protein
MTWDAYNRRKDTLREVLALADRRRDESTLTELLDATDPAREAFADETELLLDVQMAWFQRLSGQMDRLVSDGAETPEMLAVTAWMSAAAQMPGARAILDAHRDEPALQKAYAKEHAFLATSAGLPLNHPEVTTRGRRIQDSARASVVYPAVRDVADGERGGLLARLRSVLAA